MSFAPTLSPTRHKAIEQSVGAFDMTGGSVTNADGEFAEFGTSELRIKTGHTLHFDRLYTAMPGHRFDRLIGHVSLMFLDKLERFDKISRSQDKCFKYEYGIAPLLLHLYNGLQS